MSRGDRQVRRNRVNEPVAAAIGAVAGLAAVVAGAEPTGGPLDPLLVFVAVGAVVWTAASAPWWAVAAACGIAAVTAGDLALMVVGAAAFACALVIGVRRQELTILRTILAAVAVNLLIRSELGGFHGLSAVVGVAVAGLLIVAGLRRRPSAIRRPAWLVLAGVAGVLVVAAGFAGAVAMSARTDLTHGARLARQGITTLHSGDYEGAANQFADAAAAFQRADSRLAGMGGLPGRLVPGVAQNLRAATDLAAGAAAGTDDVSTALRSIDPASLTVSNGAIDIAAVAAVEAPLIDVHSALGELREVSDDVTSPWLIDRIQRELADLDRRLDANEPALETVIEAVRVAPQMLGADGPRRYMVIFTSPVEARGLAGFIGNYATLVIDDGRIEVDHFGRQRELSLYVYEHGASCAECPEEMLARYGHLGINDAEGNFDFRAWTGLTLPAHFPFTGEAVQIMLPQSGGGEIHGVISIDPHVVAALMRYTGPIELSEADVTVTPQNATQFLLRDQYFLIEGDADSEARIEVIDTLGQQVIEELLTATLPAPSVLARDLGPLVAEHRLLVWTDQPDEQALLDQVGLLGALPAQGDDGGFAFFVTDAGHSKIDYFLERHIDVQVIDGDGAVAGGGAGAGGGERRLVADVELTNHAPASGLPRYLIGNSYGLPNGTNRLWIRLFGPPGEPTVTREGEPVDVTVATPEAGWWGVDFYDVLAPGETVRYRVEYPLPASVAADGTAGDEPLQWIQPLPRRDE